MSDNLIDVYLGFMDEEINTVLNGLLAAELKKAPAQRRPVLLVERGTVDSRGPVLEWPLTRYAAQQIRVVEASAAAANRPGEDASPEGVLARAISVFLVSDEAGDASLRGKSIDVIRMFDVHVMQSLQNNAARLKVPLGGAGPVLSVVRFQYDTTGSKEAPVIVIRAPEMGLQPSLMSPYIEFLLKMVSAASSQWAHAAGQNVEWPVRISCFGAQGGASTSRPPGSLSPICASLYVGHLYGAQVTPSVAICSQGGVYHFAAKVGSKAPAMPVDGLAEWFNTWRDDLVVDRLDVDIRYKRDEEAWVKAGLTLKDVIGRLVTSYTTTTSKPEVSGTSPWFIGEEQKRAFSAVGVTGCNMEDYWVLRSMRAMALERANRDPKSRSMMPVLTRGFLTRVNADPLSIDPAVIEAFQGDLRTKTLTDSQYGDLIIWGLHGLPLPGDGIGMPDFAAWRFASNPVFQTKGTFARHLYGFLVEGGAEPVVPDPFFIEIATDLLKDCARLPQSVADVFVTAPSADALGRIGKAAQAVLDTWKAVGPANDPRLGRAIADFIGVFTRDGNFADTGSRVKVWLRPRKWLGVTANSVQDAVNQRFGDAAVDRAFYKASNLVALRQNTPSAIRK
ncbi:MAG: hypothetical protein GAK28_00498 [Luteibacter sp.]|uniref:hypothetical protein n=1 Tax=Luteibacter sp. TaxID=1886636 RepID=UPI0013821326|nr:hypothetical protein [Luteibacter sp.]KAF1008866.1 MAG: hypothetical protein GAK28_00498 [Luteibacter sp.]